MVNFYITIVTSQRIVPWHLTLPKKDLQKVIYFSYKLASVDLKVVGLPFLNRSTMNE
jgi:hypothetical protein